MGGSRNAAFTGGEVLAVGGRGLSEPLVVVTDVKENSVRLVNGLEDIILSGED